MIRVLVADDQELVRSGLRIMLEQQPDIEVCAEAATGSDAAALARTHQPDVVLLDIRMPQLDGLAALRIILHDVAAARAIMLTTYDLDEYVVQALRDGAAGFLLKDAAPAELITAVRAVAAGETALAPPVLTRIVDTYVRTAPAGSDPGIAEGGADQRIARLSDREKDVLQGLARGGTNAEIAAELFLSPATVKTHVAAILSKLGLRDRVQAVILAYESGFVDSTRERFENRRDG